jgi:acetyl/propionyl-CoA carboxylase alpha subunit
MAKSAGFATVPRTENVMKKVPFANSGEIACRIGRACQKLDLASVAIHPQIEVSALPVAQADEAVLIEAAKPVASYLDSDAIVAAALSTGARAGGHARRPAFSHG